jgi:hypothetical protein
MKKLLSYGVALVFSLSVATATYAASTADNNCKITCGDEKKGKKMSKKQCKEKCKSSTEKKGCCSHSGTTSKK